MDDTTLEKLVQEGIKHEVSKLAGKLQMIYTQQTHKQSINVTEEIKAGRFHTFMCKQKEGTPACPFDGRLFVIDSALGNILEIDPATLKGKI